MEYFVDAMVSLRPFLGTDLADRFLQAKDYEEGRLNLAYSYYYEGFFDGVPPMEEQK